jgi:hypothetical protein
MSAADALRAAYAAGVAMRLDGDGILLEAYAEPPSRNRIIGKSNVTALSKGRASASHVRRSHRRVCSTARGNAGVKIANRRENVS